MYVKVLHQDGTVEEETLGLYTDSPLSNCNEDTSYDIIYQFISSNLSDSPIYAKEDILEKNKVYIENYVSNYTEKWFSRLCEDELDSSDILMTKETFIFFALNFEHVNDAWDNFCDAFNNLSEYVYKNDSCSAEDVYDEYYDYLQAYDPFEGDMDEWANRIDEMTDAVNKEVKELRESSQHNERR